MLHSHFFEVQCNTMDLIERSTAAVVVHWKVLGIIYVYCQGTFMWHLTFVLLIMMKLLTLRAPRVLVPTPSTKGGSKRTPPPVSQEREMLQT